MITLRGNVGPTGRLFVAGGVPMTLRPGEHRIETVLNRYVRSVSLTATVDVGAVDCSMRLFAMPATTGAVDGDEAADAVVVALGQASATATMTAPWVDDSTVTSRGYVLLIEFLSPTIASALVTVSAATCQLGAVDA